MGLHVTNAQGFHEVNQVGNEDGYHVLDKRGQSDKVLHNQMTARIREQDMKSRIEAKQSADERGQPNEWTSC